MRIAPITIAAPRYVNGAGCSPLTTPPRITAMIGIVTPTRLAFDTDQCVTSQLNSTNAPSDPARVRYRIGIHAAAVVGIACDSPTRKLATRHTAAATAVPIALSAKTGGLGSRFKSTLPRAAAVAAPKTVSSPVNGTATP